MLSIPTNAEEPDLAARLIDFLVNDPEVGRIFGMSRGVPASATALAGFTPEGLDKQILDYETSIKSALTSPPPPPVEGFGTLEAAFVRIAGDLAYGETPVDQAVEEWFAEAESALAE